MTGSTYRLTSLLFALAAPFLVSACGGGTHSPDGSAPSMDGAIGRDAGPIAPQPCDSPGAIEEVVCGQCGTASRFCTVAGMWEQGPCEGEGGACLPGDSRNGSCGMCGMQAEVCSTTCAWESVGECQGGGGCTPGQLVRSADGCSTGQRDFRCSDACMLEPVSECEAEDCDSAGSSEVVACGNCGQSTRFCTSALQWEYGPCASEGVCAAGSSDTLSCGNCGEQARRCDATCQWVDFGECGGEGECVPGAVNTTTAGCPAGASRASVCDDSCTFAPAGECRAATGQRGDDCTAVDCVEGLFCDTASGFQICREACDSASPACVSGVCLDVRDPAPDICSDLCAEPGALPCPGTSTCVFSGISGGIPGFIAGTPIYLCRLNGTGGQGDVCENGSDCQQDHVCRRPAGGTAHCERVCEEGGAACPTGTACDRGVDSIGTCVNADSVADGGTGLPFFDGGFPPFPS